MLPFLFAGPVAGVVADRVDRKRLILANQIVMAVLAAGFAVLVTTGRVEVWHLFLFSLLGGIVWSFDQPVRQTIAPTIVPKKDLLNAIALSSAAFNVTRIIGPGLGGLLIAAFGPGANFFIQAAAYLGVFLMVLPIRLPLVDTASRRRFSFFSNLKEGVRYVGGQRPILMVIVMALLPSLFLMPFTMALMPVVAKETLGVGAGGLGLLMSLSGVGALVGTMALASLGNFQHKGMLLVMAITMAGVGTLLFAMSTSMSAALSSLVFLGAFQMIYFATSNTILQTITPDQFRGRVMSLYMLDMGLSPVGSVLAGVLAQSYGTGVAITVAGGFILLIGIASLLFSPTLRRVP